MRSERQVEVKLNLVSAKDSQGESNQSPRIHKTTYFHYMLELDEKGEIAGGYFLRDSSRIDMLWVPLLPKPSGEEGNERGNPHVDVRQVLAIWRDSVPADTRAKWPIADPAPEDRVDVADDTEGLTPLPIPGGQVTPPDAVESTDVVVAE